MVNGTNPLHHYWSTAWTLPAGSFGTANPQFAMPNFSPFQTTFITEVWTTCSLGDTATGNTRALPAVLSIISSDTPQVPLFSSLPFNTWNGYAGPKSAEFFIAPACSPIPTKMRFERGNHYLWYMTGLGTVTATEQAELFLQVKFAFGEVEPDS